MSQIGSFPISVPPGTFVQTLTPSAGTSPVTADGTGTIFITAGAGITTIGTGPHTITISATDTVGMWNEVLVGAALMSGDQGYITNNAGLVTLLLPAVIPQGQIIRVTGKGVGGWKIAQQAGQTIFFGIISTTPGVAGYLESTQQRDSIELLCITDNTEFNVLSVQGNILFN